MQERNYDVLIANVEIHDDIMLAMIDYTVFRNPDIDVLAVTSSSFFSNGSLFNLIPNLRMQVCPEIRSEDLSVMIDHYTSKAYM